MRAVGVNNNPKPNAKEQNNKKGGVFFVGAAPGVVHTYPCTLPCTTTTTTAATTGCSQLLTLLGREGQRSVEGVLGGAGTFAT